MHCVILNTIDILAPRSEKSIWVSESEKSFYISDIWHIGRIDLKSSTKEQLVTESKTEDEAYSMKGIYDKRMPDALFEEIRTQGISGFGLLSKQQYDLIDQNAGSTSALDFANRLGPVNQYLPVVAGNGNVFTFGTKSISMHRFQGNALQEIDRVKTKGKMLARVYLHPNQDLIVYGTNYGEIYGQHFDRDGFIKSIKIDDLQKPIYQIGFLNNGDRLVIIGMGFLKLYDLINGKFTEFGSIQTPAKSFEILENRIILNKGMHGISVFEMTDTLPKMSSIAMLFPIDRMVLNQTEKILLATSSPAKSMTLLQLFE